MRNLIRLFAFLDEQLQSVSSFEQQQEDDDFDDYELGYDEYEYDQHDDEYDRGQALVESLRDDDDDDDEDSVEHESYCCNDDDDYGQSRANNSNQQLHLVPTPPVDELARKTGAKPAKSSCQCPNIAIRQQQQQQHHRHTRANCFCQHAQATDLQHGRPSSLISRCSSDFIDDCACCQDRGADDNKPRIAKAVASSRQTPIGGNNVEHQVDDDKSGCYDEKVDEHELSTSRNITTNTLSNQQDNEANNGTKQQQAQVKLNLYQSVSFVALGNGSVSSSKRAWGPIIDATSSPNWQDRQPTRKESDSDIDIEFIEFISQSTETNANERIRDHSTTRNDVFPTNNQDQLIDLNHSNLTNTIDAEKEHHSENEDDEGWILLDNQFDTSCSRIPPKNNPNKTGEEEEEVDEKVRVATVQVQLQTNRRMALEASDIRLLRASWVSARDDSAGAGLLLFKGLFTKFPQYLDFFPHFSDLDLEQMHENKRLIKHAVKVIDTVTFVIDSIDDQSKADQLQEALLGLVKSHLKRRIGLTEFRNLGIVIIDFVCELNSSRIGAVTVEDSESSVTTSTTLTTKSTPTSTTSSNQHNINRGSSLGTDDSCDLHSSSEDSGTITTSVTTNDETLKTTTTKPLIKLDTNLLVSAWAKFYTIILDIVKQQEQESQRDEQVP